MSKISFTDQQERAINSRGNRLLVSAAAGSGKTAVLVERVLRYLSEQGGDIRRLMIMTYTTAAAEEMRQKIKKAVDGKLRESGGSDHLLRQSALIDSAEIGTVHSICLGLITRHFERLDLDPRFRLIDETAEAAMIAEETEGLIEELYGRKDQETEHFLQCYAIGRNDQALADLLVKGMKFLEDQPLPEDYIERALAPYRKKGAPFFDRFNEDGLVAYLSEELEALRVRHAFFLEKLHSHWGLSECAPLLDFFEEEQRALAELAALPQKRDYQAFADQAKNFGFAKAKWKDWLKELLAEEEIEQIKAERERIKKAVTAFIAPFTAAEEEAIACLEREGRLLETYFACCMELRARLEKARRKGGWISFHDMEQMALRLLVADYDPAADRLIPTDLALQLRQDYDEIIIDEFQDTNRVQDLIFRALSQEGKNLFMVGDMKQSIYRFRGAEPEIFDQKRRASAPYEGAALKSPTVLELNANFRSHPGILRFANAVFGAIMSPAVGGVDYTDSERLKNGRTYARPAEICAEIHHLKPEDNPKTGKKIRPVDQNARYTARLIRQMVDQRQELLLPDGLSRPVEYRDFAILLHTAKGVAAVFEQALLEQGIPVVNQNEGVRFFDLPEVQSILSYLLVLNNPYDDMALVSLLLGDYFAFSLGELAALRNRRQPLYDNLRLAAKKTEKARRAYETIEGYRKLAGTLYVYDLLYRIYQQSGILATYTATLGGAEKCANLELLAEDARLFEEEGYRGLYAFTEHIRISKSGNRGGARLQAEGNSVRIMTIHKSKGLEFPICILGDSQKTFNRTDLSERILLHPRFGAAVEQIQPSCFYRGRSVAQRVLADQILTDSISEEERVLYVALTRPESKLIILANEKEETIAQWAVEGALLGKPLPRWLLTGKDACYLRWICTLFAGAEEGEDLRLRYGLAGGRYPPLFARWVEVAHAEQGEEKPLPQKEQEVFDPQAFRARLDWVYPHLSAVRLPAKLSVSELKGLREPEEDAEPLLEERLRASAPRFANRFRPRGNEVGNALHQALQFCNFERLRQDPESELARLVENGFILEEQRKLIAVDKIRRFTQSPCFTALLEADYYSKEERFLFPMEASALFGQEAEGEILIQGVLDCYSVQGSEAMLLDYKTDRVSSPEELIRRYQVQMDLYAEALRRQKGLKVTRKVIYSFALEQAIEV